MLLHLLQGEHSTDSPSPTLSTAHPSQNVHRVRKKSELEPEFLVDKLNGFGAAIGLSVVESSMLISNYPYRPQFVLRGLSN